MFNSAYLGPRPACWPDAVLLIDAGAAVFGTIRSVDLCATPHSRQERQQTGGNSVHELDKRMPTEYP
jgi:hypothetical protein